jgi:crotonobetainyl-CoA:carnitine CoA-transferase CaiB-like acyl-CoA transferase
MDVQTSLLALAAARLFALDEDIGRSGTEHPGRVPSAAFQCADGGWLHISGSDQHWDDICTVLGLDELAADGALKKNAARVARRERVMAGMRRAIAQRERGPLAAALRSCGVPAGEVNTVREILSDPHSEARGVVGTFDHPEEGTVRALRTPLRFEGYEDPVIGCPPPLGADTAALLAEELGMPVEIIERLKNEGVI